jgi:hypothetical protein
MRTLIRSKNLKARKQHTCDLCNHPIKIGELYNRQQVKDGKDFYTVKTHYACDFVSNKLWLYIQPWDGMTDAEFYEGCCNYSEQFVCPHCEHWTDDAGCDIGRSYCLTKIIDRLKTHPLKIIADEYNRKVWAEVE